MKAADQSNHIVAEAQDELLTEDQVLGILKINRYYLRLLKKGNTRCPPLPSIKLGHKCIRYSRRQVEDWIGECGQVKVEFQEA